ncbi:DUF3800 domain-containing protein [Polaromonas sp. LjRoot131]|uniref:DUF3800 domain-containing protein n=1 Tax=Polaromonas sp. LjRoot131 TaxID=3342262 RepID=UPI003ECD7DF2
MLQAFVDDSGSVGEDKRLFLAGYIHRVETWKLFSSDWAAALNEAPPLKSLHMSQSFHRWSPAARAAKIERLAQVIQKYKPISVECSISTKDFKEVLQPHAPLDLQHPYGYCFHLFLIQSGRLVDYLGLKGPVDFVFDVQGNVGSNAAIWYEPMKQMAAPWVRAVLGGPPIFRDDEEVLPLQAADMLAWHRRAVRESSCTEEQKRVANSIIFQHAEAEISRDLLQQWAGDFSKVPGIDEVKNNSVKKSAASIIQAVRPEDLVGVMNALSARATRWRRVKAVLNWLGLRRLAKKIGKRKISL